MKARDTEREAARRRKQEQRGECLRLCLLRIAHYGEGEYLSDERIAAQVGVCAKTVSRWRRSPDFKQAEKTAREERWRKMAARLPYPVMFAMTPEDVPGLVQKCPFCGSVSCAGA